MAAMIARLLGMLGRGPRQVQEVQEDNAHMSMRAKHAHPLEAARGQLQYMRQQAARCDDPRFSSRLYKLVTLADAIIRETTRKPGLRPIIHRFFAFDLPVTALLLERYDRLMQSEYYNNEMEYRAKRIEHLLGTLVRRYIRYLNRFKHAEMTQMDMELAAYERMLRHDESSAR